jgi:hypothetical protein
MGPAAQQPVSESVAAEMIGMSVAFPRAARTRGTVGNRTPGPPYLKIGAAIRYRRDDLEAWLAERRVDPSARVAQKVPRRAAR